MDKVSVIMPTYKRSPDMIARAIASVLSQSYENIELLIVDDSPDTFEGRYEVEGYIDSLNDPRILYIKNEENMGGALARNEGIFKASGEYITFLDDDDMYKKDKVKNQLEAMKENDYDMTFENLILQNEEGKTIDVREFHDIKSMDQRDFLKYHIMYHATGTPTFMYKAKKLREIGGFDDAIMGQEFYLMLKSIEAGLKIGYLDLYDVIAFRHSGESISSGMNKIKGQKILQEKKKEYFHLFNKKEIRFINMRNRLVLFVAYFRNNMYLKSIAELFAAFFTSPIQFFEMGFSHLGAVLRQK